MVTSFSPFPSRAGEWKREDSAAGWLQPQHATKKPKGPETLARLPQTCATWGTSSLGQAQSRDCGSCSPSHTSSCCSPASGLLQSRELLQILPRQPEQMLYQPRGRGETANGQQCLKPLGCPWRQGQAEMAAEGINVTRCWQRQLLNLQLSLPSC